MNNIIASTVLQIMAPVFLAVLTIAAGVVSEKVTTYLGAKNEKLLRDAIHAAAENGVKLATAKGLSLGSPNLVAVALDYIKTLSPANVKKSGLDDGQLTDIIKSKLPPV